MLTLFILWRKNNDKKIKTETFFSLSLSLFVNLESSCIAWEANTMKTEEEEEGWEEEGEM